MIAPLPPILYGLHDAHAALRQLSAARHVGKIVVTAQRALPVPDQARSKVNCHSYRFGSWVVRTKNLKP